MGKLKMPPKGLFGLSPISETNPEDLKLDEIKQQAEVAEKAEDSKQLTNELTNQLTEELTTELTVKLTGELTEELTAKLTSELTEQLTEELTTELTNKLTAQLTKQLTGGLTKQLTSELTGELTENNPGQGADLLASLKQSQDDDKKLVGFHLPADVRRALKKIKAEDIELSRLITELLRRHLPARYFE